MLEVIIRERFMHPKQHVPKKREGGGRERGGGGERERGGKERERGGGRGSEGWGREGEREKHTDTEERDDDCFSKASLYVINDSALLYIDPSMFLSVNM